jgi:type 1 fimbria pilin
LLGIDLKHSLTTLAAAAGLLAAAGPASAATHPSGVIAYNGHAGVKDGTSNTIAFGERAAGFSIDIGTSENIASDGLGAD